VDDIPGALIPSVYFKYLECRNASEIIKVISHNEKDILSMVSLLCTVGEKLGDPASADGEELFGLGRIFEAEGKYDKGIECFEACVDLKPDKVRVMALRKLAEIYKRKGDYEKAVLHWTRLVSEKEAPPLFPLIELAKYYEHKAKDLESAIAVVEKAIGLNKQLSLLKNYEMEELKKRYDRLKKKAGRRANGQ
jgi:tetratricopeptide (TPR) repeat protein